MSKQGEAGSRFRKHKQSVSTFGSNNDLCILGNLSFTVTQHNSNEQLKQFYCRVLIKYFPKWTTNVGVSVVQALKVKLV